ncbi:C39 family peptidase [Nocardioides sp. W7]|uniref:C39 family peptidase n=1 Tax=Nocardioides sp. W7 TaxID=2931390 RepID=UPI001FD21BA9|nr:C39 family peptidase [Nocardioides sp. W7]
MSRPRWIAIGALALLLAVAPFVPRGGDDDDGAITPSGQQEYDARPAAAAGLGQLTPTAADEIERVLEQGQRETVAARATPAALAASLTRCAEFEGQRYCLGTGWTQDTQAEVQARVAGAARPVAARARPVEQTGDLDTASRLRRTAALPPAQRAAQERAELTSAARSVAKVWLLRHELQGVPLPDGFLERHPEARAVPGAAPVARTSAADYPASARIMKARQVASQTQTYWCGPATMQMIAWGWRDRKRAQSRWAARLGTTTDGTAISNMVATVNSSTGWDRTDHAGPYIVLDIGDWSYRQWSRLIMKHIAVYRAPVVLHPILLKRFYPYIDDDASGHFQVGRGYRQRPGKAMAISYFEPWDQQRFDRSEPYVERVQWRSAYKSYRANKEHPHQNIGV